MTETWRFIDTGPCRAAYNMALDEAIAREVRKDNAPPTLRLYGWDMPSVSFGCFQKISEVDLDYCKGNNIPIIRRPTGGRAILHNHELTYSFSVKTAQEPFSKGLLDSYRKISKALSLSLSRVGFSPESKLIRETRHSKSPLCFQSISYSEISIDRRKVIGSAQKRWPDGLLQQGSIPYTIEESEMQKIFKLESPQGIREAMVGLKDVFPDLNPDTLKEAIKSSFEETFNVRLIPSPLSRKEVLLAQELEAQRYLTPEWNFQR